MRFFEEWSFRAVFVAFLGCFSVVSVVFLRRLFEAKYE